MSYYYMRRPAELPEPWYMTQHSPRIDNDVPTCDECDEVWFDAEYNVYRCDCGKEYKP